jgi:hypothetical protein
MQAASSGSAAAGGLQSQAVVPRTTGLRVADEDEPLLSICLADSRRQYGVGDELVCEYQIDAVDAADIQAVEASVLWITEGKGEEDMGVHFFERRLPGDAEDGDLRPMRRFRTRLPNSPLSYVGAILNIRWCVRLRLFLRRGRETVLEYPFTLGSVPAATLEPPPSIPLPARGG